jgi:hypothetical protein
MSLDIIPKLPFPNVPNLPGVPLLARASLTAIVDETSIINIASVFETQAPVNILFHATKAAPVWGVFDANGNLAIAADNVMAFDYRADFALSTYPVQEGQFASYNKVVRPFDTSVVLTKGGTVNDRTNFLNACETVAASLNLYNILTPEKNYMGVNVTRMEMSRKETKGAFFVSVELFFQQIQEVNAQYNATGAQGTNMVNASNAPAVPTVNQGNVNAQPPSAQTATTVASKLTAGQ